MVFQEKQDVELQSVQPISSYDDRLAHVETYQTTYDQDLEPKMYQDGQLVKMPAASRDPKDPLNMALWHKIISLGCLSFFGALIASAEIILGAALPVFVFEYNDQPVSLLVQVAAGGGLPAGTNSLVSLEAFGQKTPVFNVFLLATIPVLTIGLTNLFFVPCAIAFGRRPVIIVTGLIAISGAAWAGASTSLPSHIGARVLQAIGAASVESLIPFIIQDITHVHERNTWIAAAFGCQGLIIIAIGFSAPYLIVNLSWRWLYHITAIIASFFLIGVIFLLPETRWQRTRSEMNGIPRSDANVQYSPRTFRTNLKLFSGVQLMRGVYAFLDTMRTFFYPSILFVTLLNGSVIASAFAAAFMTCPALLVAPWSWPFQHLGLCLIAVLIGAIAAAAITGGVADYFANAVAKKRGRRVPENQLVNLFLPWACAFLGALLFGLSGGDQTRYSWVVFLLSLAFMCFGFLGTSTITTVYVLESYPQMAGPALVNVASFRWIMAFFLTLWASDWVVYFGYFRTFMIYTGLIAFFGLCIPIVYVWGPGWRKRWPGPQRNKGEISEDY